MKQQIANVTASVADLGLILPLTLGLSIASGMNTGVVLMGLGLFALVSGVMYGRPVPVQPMKVIAAMAIVGQLSAGAIVATGILLGFTLILLGITGWAGRLRKLVSNPVLIGIQTALGGTLLLSAWPMVEPQWFWVLPLLGLFIYLKRTRLHPVAFILIVALSVVIFWVPGQSWPALASLGMTIPEFAWPSANAFIESLNQAFFPQVALTLSNALFLVAVMAREYYPEDHAKLSENRFALSSGFMNLLLAPWGAMPMCHGAGGLAAYHGAGGRNGIPVIVLGVALLLLGFFTGAAAAEWVSMIPQASFGLLLLITASYMVDIKKLSKQARVDLITISVIVLIALTYSMLLALLAGMLIDRILHSRQWEPKQSNA